MKNIIVLLLSTLSIFSLKAQELKPLKMNNFKGAVPQTNHFNVSCFQIEDLV